MTSTKMINGYKDHSPLPSSQQTYEYGGARSKMFNDSVHGHITLHRASVAIIDTPEFQRLRNLKQLGLTYYIYPGSSHNRFEHSLGVAHLATEWGQHLIGSRGGPEPDGWQLRNFEPEDRRNLTVLQLAGLCHDLGHGPFSHVFEKELLPKLYPGQPEVVKEWHHETMSNKIFDHITTESSNNIDLMELAGLTECDLALVNALMHGSENPAGAHPSAPWLYDVVANKRNGIDVDKFDYLLRDSKMCGVSVPLDHKRLMLLSRLDRNKEQVIFKMTEYGNLAVGLFQSRAEMHRRVYTHQKVKSIEFMVCDALALAQEPLGLRDALSDINMYLKLDDTLLQRVQWLKPEDAQNPRDIIKAQQLLDCLSRRQLYKFVREVTVDARGQAQLHKHCQGGVPTPAQVVGHQSAAAYGVDLVDHLNDIIICETHIDGGMKDANPMDAVLFYQTTDAVMGDRSFAMPQQQVSSMLGTVYQDKKIRVYCKLSDRNIREALKYAFEQWAKQVLNCEPPGTPWKKPLQQQPRDVPSGRLSLPNVCSGLQQQPGSVLRGFNAAAAEQDGSSVDRSPAGGGADLFAEHPACRSSGMEELDLQGFQSEGQQQHAGSGGRSRKRSLSQEMAAASQQLASQHSLTKQQQSQQQHRVQASVDDASDNPAHINPMDKQRRLQYSTGSRQKPTAAAGSSASSRLPGISEEGGNEDLAPGVQP